MAYIKDISGCQQTVAELMSAACPLGCKCQVVASVRAELEEPDLTSRLTTVDRMYRQYTWRQLTVALS